MLALVPAFQQLRDLGSCLIPREEGASARDRIIAYLKRYPRTVINGDELMVVSGIGEWARRVRELRVQYGWWIYSGVTFADIASEEEEGDGLAQFLGKEAAAIRPDQYVLMRDDPDRDSAHRWNILNEVRRMKLAVKDRLLEYFRRNVGAQITGEELKYLARDRKEWARRVRELRTEEGWPIVTRNSGREDLAIGVYVLEEDRQAFPHDRAISDLVRVAVLQRDGHRCVECHWARDHRTTGDPRHILELHHRKHHAQGGENIVENLITLCNVCHDDIHRRDSSR